jgi:hypothetical protein
MKCPSTVRDGNEKPPLTQARAAAAPHLLPQLHNAVDNRLWNIKYLICQISD